jgi:predicted dehydrogenase
MSRIKVGVIGAGTISQVEHVPNLVRLTEKFEVAGIADPSKISRDFVRRTYGVRGFATVDELLGERLDAVVIGSPDALHHEQLLSALERGLHVFCEKPLCYSPADIDDVIRARDKAGKVVQVGYMKRYDPNYQLALDNLPGEAKTLRYISVEVNDPDAWPFIRHYPTERGADIPREMIEEAASKQRDQIARAIGKDLDATTFRGFANSYASSMVHDVNAVHGILERLGIPDGEIVGGEIFAGGEGAQGAVRLLNGQAMWNMVHLVVPALADYRERITLYFDDATLELEFPSPWLNHQPTRVKIKKSNGHTLSQTELRAGYEEAFIEEMLGFWNAIVNGTPTRNPAEHAQRDQALLCGFVKWHVTGRGSAGQKRLRAVDANTN